MSTSPSINNNLWGMSTGSGSQCLDAASGGDPVAWSTTWSWENTASDQTGQHYIKSYANAYKPSITCQALGDFKSIPTSWTWRCVLVSAQRITHPPNSITINIERRNTNNETTQL